jgi:hypothetical protein
MKCPYCGFPIQFAPMFLHGAALGGRHGTPQCDSCGGRGYLARGERNTYWAIAILLVGFLASYPSPISHSLFAGFSGQGSAIARTGIWALAVLSATCVFVFTGRLSRVGRDQIPLSLLKWPTLIVEWIFLGGMLWWMYAMYSGITHPT